MFKKKRTLIFLAISLSLMLLSAIVGQLVITSFGAVDVTMLKNASNSSTIQVEGVDTSFDGLVVSGALFVPKQASADNKLPAIVLTHGYLNDWEKQYQNAIELSKRGFVILAVDRAGHGENTQPIEGSLGFGGTTADYDQTLTLAGRYLYNLDYVDRDRIGVSGHSMGGFATSMALMKDATNAYGFGVKLFSAGLQQAWETSYGAGEGVSVGIIKSNDDEFFFSGIDPATGAEYTSRQWLGTTNARNFVKSADTVPVVSGHIYVGGTDMGTFSGGTTAEPGFRAVYEANEIHTLNHFSIASSANVTNFFYTSFGVPSGYEYLSEGSQTWWIKEAFGLLGIIGFYMLLLPLFDLLLATPLFSSLRRSPAHIEQPHELKGVSGWAMFIIPGLIGSLFAGFALRSISNFAAKTWHTSALFPQEHSNWLGYWCLVNGLVVVGLAAIVAIIRQIIRYHKTGDASLTGEFVGSARAEGGFGTVAKSFLLAALVFTASMLILAIIKKLFQTDFRLWLYTVKSISLEKIPTAMRYFPVFLVFYGVNAWNVSNSRFKNLSEGLTTLLLCIFNCLGLALVFAIQYITFKSTGSLWHSDMGTRYPTLLTIIPILCVATVYSKKLYNRTGNCWTAAFITAFLATFACVGGTCAAYPYTFL